jgi:tripartite-type tricarboxylate transporter receptor subunit TctC
VNSAHPRARAALLLISAAVSGFSHFAAAQNYPSRTVRIVDVFPPGGGTDVVGLVLAAKLSPVFGQSFVVENRPGAAGTIGADSVAKSPPDGYTLFIVTSISLGANTMYAKLPYDTLKDFAPIAKVGSAAYVLVAHPSLPVKSVKELIALAKTRPGQLNYGSAGTGSSTHLAGELLKSRAGIDIVHVPYKGSAPVVIAIVSGETEFGFAAVTSALGQINSGKLRALGVSSLQRNPAMPGVPTVAETLPGFEAVGHLGIYAPARIPADIVARLNAELQKAVAQSDVRERFAAAGVEPGTSSPDELAAILKNEIAKWSKVIKDAGIRAD